MKLSKTRSGIYASLGSSKMRRRHGLFTVEGEKSVSDTLGAFPLEAIIHVSGCCPNCAIGLDNVYEVDEAEMKRLSNLSTPSDVMAVYRLPETEVNPDSLHLADGLYMVLDGVQDPGNLGTIVRTCHWFGIYQIFASCNTVDIFNPKTVQATMGSIARVNVSYCDLSDLFRNNPDLPVYGLLLDGRDIFQSSLGDKGFIVMGNEGNGISTGLRPLITDPLLIPPAGPDHSESLNVAIAAAITLAAFRGK